MNATDAKEAFVVDPAQGLHVLLVDDDQTHLALMEQLVEGLGHRVSTAANGRQVLERMAQAPPHVIVTDLMMPELDGEELVQKVKATNPAIPVIIMSVVDSAERAVKLLKSGADDYLTKPVSPKLMQRRLECIAARLAGQREVRQLRDLVGYAFNPGDDFVLGPSVAILKVAAKIPALACTDATILIWGESGTGKELVARAIHRCSRRAQKPMVAVSCASIPDGLWEREFFGHVKGAFSDAGSGARGVIAEADGGTLFLDEVGETPLSLQPKLLRFLQEKEYRPVGATQANQADIRLVSATNRDLQQEVQQGRFREDLFYRLNVIPLQMPSLRERKEDIPHLATFFLRRHARAFDKAAVVGFSPLALQRLCSHDFPGNVRELENVVQQALVAARYTVISADDLPVGDPALREVRPEREADPVAPSGRAEASGSGAAPAPRRALEVAHELPYGEAKQQTIRDFERSYVVNLLDQHDGNASRAARAAGIPRTTLTRIMARHGLSGCSASRCCPGRCG